MSVSDHTYSFTFNEVESLLKEIGELKEYNLSLTLKLTFALQDLSKRLGLVQSILHETRDLDISSSSKQFNCSEVTRESM